MKRLRIGKGLTGLPKRREMEATLVENTKRKYRAEELVSL